MQIKVNLDDLMHINQRFGGICNLDIVSLRLCVHESGLGVEWNLAQNVGATFSLLAFAA